LVKALSAGALLVAAALPMAVAAGAGAATPSYALTSASVTKIGTATTTGDSFAAGASGVITIGTSANFANDGGTVTVTSNATGVTFSNAVESSTSALTVSFASTTSVGAGTYNLQVADNAGTSYAYTNGFTVNANPTVTGVSPNTLAAGQSAQITVTGTGFTNTSATDLNAKTLPTITLTSTVDGTKLEVNPTSTYSSGSQGQVTTGGTAATFSAYVWGTTTASAAATAGTYTMTVSNSDGGTVTTPAIFTVTANGLTNVSPSDIAVPATTASTTAVVLTGAGFQSSATVTIGTQGASTVLSTTTVATSYKISGAGFNVFTEGAAPSTCSLATNPAVGEIVTGTGIPAGTYVASVGTACASGTTPEVFTLSATFTSALADSTAFKFTPALFTLTQFVSPSQINGNVQVGPGISVAAYDVTVTNTAPGNGAVDLLSGGLGLGHVATPAPTITSVTSPTAALAVGATTPSSFTIAGWGFDPLVTEAATFTSTASGTSSGVTATCTSNAAGTAVSCSATANNGATAGSSDVTITNTGSPNTTLKAIGALTVAGPAIVSSAPAVVAANSPVGTTYTLTGTGFNNTAALTGSGGLSGVIAVQSPTSATFALTVSPTAANAAATIQIKEYLSNGDYVLSSAFSLPVTAAPTVSSLVDVNTGTAGVGAGAVSEPILITGSGFQTGATVGGFVNLNGVADTGVTVTGATVNTAAGTIKGLINIPAGDVNISDGYTITNPDGGTVKVYAFGTGALTINAGPTITAVTPSAITANSTGAFTVTGTGFTTKTVVSTSSATSTCGVTTFVSLTTLTASCTFTSVTGGVNLIVKNADGGAASFALTVPAVTPPVTPPAVNLHTTGAHGFAVVGRTVVITITGGGFYGQPRLTSNAAGVSAVVVKDNGKMLTVRVTVRAGAARGWHTFTIRLANGKMAKVNYLTK
jgi:hypothetical protein